MMTSTRWLSAFTALAVLVTLATAGQGCGVMSFGECTDKGSCAEVDTGTTGDDAPVISADANPGTGAEGGDDAPGVPPGDDATVEVDTGGADATIDTGPADTGIDRGVDTGIDARIDVGVDTGIDAAVDTGVGSPDACVPGAPEDCTNGFDDNCDGLIDCADPQCQPAFTCVPTAPTGWVGPVEFWQAANPATAPGCDTGYGGALRDGQGGAFTASPATCGCTCSATGQVCSQSGSFFTQTNCAGTCATVTPAADGTCTPVPGNGCGSQGSFSLALGTPTGGVCSPSPSTTVPPVTWATSERVCSYTGPTDNPGGCSGAGGASCVRAPAGAAGGYSAGACVYSTADPPPTACPAGFTAIPPLTFYARATDTRGCATCTCRGTPSGGTGSCTGTVDLYGKFPDAGCTGAHDTYDAGATAACQCIGQVQCGANDAVVLNNTPGFVQAHYTVTPGTCGMPGRPASTGTAAPATPTTVCCR